MKQTEQFTSIPIKPSEITPEHVYLSRREFIKMMGLAGAGALLAACTGQLVTPQAPATTEPPDLHVSAQTDELGNPLTPYGSVTHYNNYYEFSTAKDEVVNLAVNFKTSPWTVRVGGLVNKPATISIEDLLKKYPQEERIYRLRCVEGWSMVIPWLGFPLSKLLKDAEPTGDAKFVRFDAVLDPDQMPGQHINSYPWPYEEGLRLDEAMHDLTILATGLYGKPLPPQDGAPLRLVVPWKYGFKSIKAISIIELVDKQPSTLWSTVAPNEYGFYSNVNPDVDHPRWSQATERRIGELDRRPTLMFNGYSDQVASLYTGMDLRKNF